MTKRKRRLEIEHLAVGDIIEFYDEGFRFAIIDRIQQKKSRKTQKISHVIHTDRYGKVDFTKVREVYMQTEEGTKIKPLFTDLFA